MERKSPASRKSPLTGARAFYKGCGLQSPWGNKYTASPSFLISLLFMMVELCVPLSPKRYVEVVLTPSISDDALTWKQDHGRCN